MSKIGDSGSSHKSSSASSTQKTQKTQKSSSSKPTTKQPTVNTTKKGDHSTLSNEKGKVGSTPDFGASFGGKSLKKGAQGDNVKALQQALNERGAKLDVDGKFGADTQKAVKAFQDKQHIATDGIAGKDTFSKLQSSQPDAKTDPAAKADPAAKVDPAAKTDPGAKVDPAAKTDPGAKVDPAAKPGGGDISLPPGYGGLEKLSGELNKRDPRFNTTTPDGRSATALALAIGGTEQFGKDTKATDFFTAKGGTGNNMKGFGQFNQAYHSAKTSTPEKYTKFMGDILTGDARMPNSKSGGNHVAALSEAVKSGKIKTGDDLKAFMKQRGFGGSNWQGIDDGWGRNPGLANALVNMLKQGG